MTTIPLQPIPDGFPNVQIVTLAGTVILTRLLIPAIFLQYYESLFAFDYCLFVTCSYGLQPTHYKARHFLSFRLLPFRRLLHS